MRVMLNTPSDVDEPVEDRDARYAFVIQSFG
jgi:hypothetical protein